MTIHHHFNTLKKTKLKRISYRCTEYSKNLKKNTAIRKVQNQHFFQTIFLLWHQFGLLINNIQTSIQQNFRKKLNINFFKINPLFWQKKSSLISIALFSIFLSPLCGRHIDNEISCCWPKISILRAYFNCSLLWHSR